MAPRQPRSAQDSIRPSSIRSAALPVGESTTHDERLGLMSRAGVQTEIAERVLGHAQGELIEIYDQHTYQDEMAAVLEKLAALIEQITSS